MRALPRRRRPNNNRSGYRYVSPEPRVHGATLYRVSIVLVGYPVTVRRFGGPNGLEDAIDYRNYRLTALGFELPDDDEG